LIKQEQIRKLLEYARRQKERRKAQIEMVEDEAVIYES
jgi:hypothetical protein